VASLRGAHDEAADTLSLVARAFEKWDMLLYAKAADYRRGILTGRRRRGHHRQRRRMVARARGEKRAAVDGRADAFF
jgi:hypothetical protein